MKRNTFSKKAIVLGIIILFVGASIIPLTGSKTVESTLEMNSYQKHTGMSNSLWNVSLLFTEELELSGIADSVVFGKALDANGGPPDEEWNKTFGEDYTSGTSLAQTSDGGFIITGTIFTSRCFDVLLLKTNETGDYEWQKTFSRHSPGEPNIEVGYSIKQTDDDGYIITGITNDRGVDIWLIKTDEQGNEQWNYTFGGTESEVGYSVQQTIDRGFIVCGYSESYGTGNHDVWLVKTDINGVEEWNKTFGGIGHDFGNSIHVTNDGGYIITGSTDSYGAGETDAWVIKTDTSGNEEWNKTYGGTEDDTAHSVDQTADGGYIVAGSSYSSYQDGDFWLIKIDSNGIEQWNTTHGGIHYDFAKSVQETSDGGYIATGWTQSYGAGDWDIWLIKTDNEGNEQWNLTFGGTATDLGESVQQTIDGGYILTGLTDSYGNGSTNLWLIKVGKELPNLKISNITGGFFKIKAKIRNMDVVGTVNVSWSITLNGGLIFLGRETKGTINIPAGDEKEIISRLIFGIGKPSLTITIELPDGSSKSKKIDACVLLFLILLR